MGDPGEATGLVVVLDHQDVALDDQGAVRFEDRQGAGSVIDDHPDDGVVGGVGDGESVDVDLCAGKGIADGGQRPRLVL